MLWPQRVELAPPTCARLKLENAKANLAESKETPTGKLRVTTTVGLGTGWLSSRVQEFVELAFGSAGLNWRDHVVEDAGRITRRYRGLLGDAEKLRAATGWAPSVSFCEMVRLLLNGRTDE